MFNSGVGLDDSYREKFNKLQLEASELSTKFSNNLLDSTKEFKLLITDQNEIDGLPKSTRAIAAQAAVNSGHPLATAEHGPWQLTLDMPS